MRRPQRAILTHWFNPPHIVPVVEVVPGRQTSDSTTQIAVALLERIGKLPVRLNQEIPGFLVNRVQMAMYREVWDLLERGIASPEDIDRAIRGSMGFRLAAIGPLQVSDFAGLDIVARVYQTLVPDIRRDTQLPAVIARLLNDGRCGVKAGQGIYDYTPQTIERKQARRDRRYLELVKLLGDDA
jgi:3-hydroxybutyryl-CoA dehydrogenase